jgi:hypothetical protein
MIKTILILAIGTTQSILTDPLHIDTQFNEIWNNDNQHNDSKHNCTQHGKQLFQFRHVQCQKCFCLVISLNNNLTISFEFRCLIKTILILVQQHKPSVY